MFGVGKWEMLIFGTICLMVFLPGIIGIGVLIWYGMKRNNKSSSQED